MLWAATLAAMLIIKSSLKISISKEKGVFCCWRFFFLFEQRRENGNGKACKRRWSIYNRWGSWERLHLYLFYHTKMYTRGKKSTSAYVLWKKRKLVKFYSICVVIIIFEVLRFPRPVNLYGLNKKWLFSFSSLLFLETCSKYQRWFLYHYKLQNLRSKILKV